MISKIGCVLFGWTLCTVTCVPINSGTTYRLGVVGDKEYFISTVKMTWKEADAYCKKIGSRLASVASPIEQNFLDREAFFNIPKFRGDFWTSGRIDSNNPYKYTWGNGVTAKPSAVFSRIHHFEGEKIRSCLAYHSIAPMSHLDNVPCAVKKYVLCEN